jgi:hypothetical protein
LSGDRLKHNFYEDKTKRHFRGRYVYVHGRRVAHPNYIIGEDEKTYTSIGFTHSPTKVGSYHKLYGNIVSNDTSSCYMQKNIKTRKKKTFSKKKYDKYNFTNQIDCIYIDDYIKKHKKK